MDGDPQSWSNRVRPRSVLGRIESRRWATEVLVVASSLVVLATAVSPCADAALVAGPLLILLAARLAGEVATLASVLLDARRMERGRPPRRASVDYGVGPDVWWATVPPDHAYRAQERAELVALGSPRLAARVLVRSILRRAVTAASLMLASSALGTCVHLTEVRHTCHRASTTVAAQSIRSATILYRSAHGDGPDRACPTVATLRGEAFLDRGFYGRDPWGGAWEVRCADDDVIVRSNGPDRKAGTADDVVVPTPDAHDARR